MTLRFAGGMILLAASGLSQQIPTPQQPAVSPNGGRGSRAMITKPIKAAKSPKLVYAEFYDVAPQVVDGLQAGQGVWTTQLQVINLDPNYSAPFELDFYNPDGSAASVGIVCPAGGSLGTTACTPGVVTSTGSVSGSLAPLQELSYVTGGLPLTTAVYWAMLNQSVGGYYSSGYYVTVNETINLFNAAANYLSSESGPSDFGIYNYQGNPGSSMPFDNTNGSFTTAAFVNPDAQIDAQLGPGYAAEVPSLQIFFYNTAGTLIDSETYFVASGTQTNVILSDTWPLTAGQAGIAYIIPYVAGCANDTANPPGTCPKFSDITVLALQAKYVQNASGFSHTNSFVPLLTIGDYTN